MISAKKLNRIKMTTHFIDVVYLTNAEAIPEEVKKMFRKKKLKFQLINMCQASDIFSYLDRIGNVVIEAVDVSFNQQIKLAGLIENLEMKNIGTILIGSKVRRPVRSFELASVKSFVLASSIESISVDELWFKISVNLASRKNSSSNIFIKNSNLHLKSNKFYLNTLEEQFNMTEALVGNIAEQLRLAGLVQQDFLPDQLPDSDKLSWSATFMPAEWVSGDIYDAVRLDEHHIGFYIADVVGHSMPAALLTIFIKQALVMRKTNGNSYTIFQPAEVLRKLNLKMTAQKLSGYQFATCCYCLLDTEKMTLTYARAGHPYPVLLRKGKSPEQLEVRGSLLGIFEQAQYHQETVQLEKSDKIFLYSDGAEPFLGEFNSEKASFSFSKEFSQIQDKPLNEMFDKLNIILRCKKIAPSEKDDITALALEVL